MTVFAGSFSALPLMVAWFVGLIVILYLLYPFLSKAIQVHSNYTLLTALLISVVSRILVGTYWMTFDFPLDWFPPCRLFEFTLGIWLMTKPRTIQVLSRVHISKGKGAIIFFSNLSYAIYLNHATVLLFVSNHVSSTRSFWLIPPLFILGTLLLSFVIFEIDILFLRNSKKILNH